MLRGRLLGFFIEGRGDYKKVGGLVDSRGFVGMDSRGQKSMRRWQSFPLEKMA